MLALVESVSPTVPAAAGDAVPEAPSIDPTADDDAAVEFEVDDVFDGKGTGDDECEIEIDTVSVSAGPSPELIEEVDALIEGGALDEARRRLLKLRGEHPDRSEVEERLTRVGMLERQAEAPVTPAAAEGEREEFFDLASELDEALFEPQVAVEPEMAPDLAEGHSLEDLVDAFKKGVEKQVDSDDFETHYNLAIAYKEMGLIDEAIGEFQFASRSTDFFLKCCSMLGICFRDKGMMALAVKWYEKGLESVDGGDEDAELGLRYDLAGICQESGDPTRALTLFTEVYGVNANYRDVADRIKDLKDEAGASK